MEEKKNSAIFNGSDWFDKIVDQRTKEALKKRNAEFGKRFGKATDEQLIEYVKRCAKDCKKVPNISEVIGGHYIAERFGSWANVMLKAGLPQPKRPAKVRNRKIYKDEFRRQAVLFREERLQAKEEKKAKRQNSEEVNSSPSNCDDK